MNRKLATLSSFCELHARHGVPLGDLLVTMRPAGHRGRGSSYKPFLEHIAKSRPPEGPRDPAAAAAAATGRAVRRGRPGGAGRVRASRDRLLFALLLDTGLRIGEALGLRQRGHRARRAAGERHPAAEREIVNLWGPPARPPAHLLRRL
ncbi:hypothetical protein ACF1DY_32745 [Streptomyces albus]